MKLAERIAYEAAIEDCIRAVSEATADSCEPVLVEVFNALQSVKPERPSRVMYSPPMNYLEEVQRLARRAWRQAHGVGSDLTGPSSDAIAGIDTPVGRLKAITWRKVWTGKRGGRVCWSTEYYLDDEPVTLDEIRKAGLAKGIRQRLAEAGIEPKRRRKKKEPEE